MTLISGLFDVKSLEGDDLSPTLPFENNSFFKKPMGPTVVCSEEGSGRFSPATLGSSLGSAFAHNLDFNRFSQSVNNNRRVWSDYSRKVINTKEKLRLDVM